MDKRQAVVRELMEPSENSPIARLIEEIKVSNTLSVSAIRLHYVALAVLLLIAAAIWSAVISIRQTSQHLIDLDNKSASLVIELEALSKKMTAQAVATEEVKTQLDEAPKIVADSETGQLKVVATVDKSKVEKKEEPAAPSSPAISETPSAPMASSAQPKIRKSAQRALAKVDDALGLFPMAAEAAAPESVTIEIPIDTSAAAAVAKMGE